MKRFNLNIVVTLVFLLAAPVWAAAQTNVEEERSSLSGLDGVGLTVNIEQNTAFTDSQLVKISTIREQSIRELKNSNIQVYSDNEVEASIRVPVLYLHLNLLSTKTGIISFSVTSSLYQPVKLVLQDDEMATASTWESSTVGIASYDKISIIEHAALGMIQNFINDYQRVNSD